MFGAYDFDSSNIYKHSMCSRDVYCMRKPEEIVVDIVYGMFFYFTGPNETRGCVDSPFCFWRGVTWSRPLGPSLLLLPAEKTHLR